MPLIAGGKPLSPRSVRQLNIQYYHWSELRIGDIVKVSMQCCADDIPHVWSKRYSPETHVIWHVAASSFTVTFHLENIASSMLCWD
jgi:hypothetical protein